MKFDGVYGSRTQDIGAIVTTIDTQCTPMDGATRIVEIKNLYMSLTSNVDKDRFIQYYSEYVAGSDRTEIIIYENNYHENIVDSIYAMFDVYLQPNVQIFFNNNTFVGVSGLFGGAYIYNAGEINMKDNIYVNSSDFGIGMMNFMSTESVKIDGITIDNVVATGTSFNYGINFKVNEGSNITINNLNTTNSNMGFQSLIHVGSMINKFTLTNSKIESTSLSSNIALVTLMRVETIYIDTLS